MAPDYTPAEIIVMLRKGNALAREVEAEHARNRTHTRLYRNCQVPLCQLARAWQAPEAQPLGETA